MNTKTKIALLEAGKWICVLLVAAFLVSKCWSGKESTTEFEVVKEAVVAQADVNLMQEADNQMVKRLYGLDPASFEGVLLYTPTTNMGSEELLVIKLANLSQQETVVSAIETRIATQMDSFEGYAQTQYEMLENAVIEVQGNYILFVSAADPSPLRQAFLDTL